jgi:hypothetical protein
MSAANCSMDQMPAGAWMVDETKRWQLPLPQGKAADLLVVIALHGSVSPGEVGRGTDVPTFLRYVAALLDAGYPLAARAGRWTWAWRTCPHYDSANNDLHGSEARAFLLAPLRKWAIARSMVSS